MEVIKALIWKEARELRRETLLFAGLAVVAPMIATAGMSSFADFQSVAPAMLLGTLASFALLLGAGMSAGDRGLDFLRTRAVSWATVTLARFAARGLACCIVAVLGLGTLLAWSDARGWILAGLFEDGLFLPMAVFFLGFLGAGALASAYSQRPLAAAVLGLTLFTLGVGGATPWTQRMEMLGGCLVLCLLAVAASGARTGRQALRKLPSVLTVLALIAIALGIGHFISQHEFERAARAAREAWSVDALAGPELVLVKAPRTRNETADRLSRFAASEGLDVASWVYTAGKRTYPNTPGELSALAQDIRELTVRQPDVPRFTMSELGDLPPEELARIVNSRDAVITRLRDLLSEGEAPRWRERPNVQGCRELHRILFADALVAGRRGLAERCVADLRASARLAEAYLVDYPTSLWAPRGGGSTVQEAPVSAWLEVMEGHAMLVRETSFLSDEQLTAYDDVDAIALTLAAARRVASETIKIQPGAASWARLRKRRIRPTPWTLLRESWTESKAQKRVLTQLLDIALIYGRWLPERPCEVQLEGGGARYFWRTAVPAQLHLELTRQVLQLRERQGAMGRWPTRLSEDGPPTCRCLHWRYTTSADRKTMSLALSGIEGYDERHAALLAAVRHEETIP